MAERFEQWTREVTSEQFLLLGTWIETRGRVDDPWAEPGDETDRIQPAARVLGGSEGDRSASQS